MQRSAIRLSVFAEVIFIAGCGSYGPSFDEGLPCSPNEGCPSEQACFDGICRAEDYVPVAGGPDAGSGADAETSACALSITFEHSGPGLNLVEDIFRLDLDGGAPIRLTDNPTRDFDSHWSRDGSKLSFISDREGNLDVFTMNPDGSGQTNRSNHPADDDTARWSPDGTRIAFRSERSGNSDVFVMDADGGNVTNLSQHPGVDLMGAWSSDGTKILITSDRDGGAHIYSVDVGTRNVTRLTAQGENNVIDVAYIHSGSRLLFVSDRDGDREVFSMNEDGTDLQQITMNSVDDTRPMWLPNGRIAYIQSSDTGSHILSVGSGGEDMRNLSNDPTSPGGLWAEPSSEHVLFLSGRDDPSTARDVFLVENGVNDPINLTMSGTVNESGPRIRPCGY